VMMMIAFITINSGLVPLIEGLCAQILYFRFEISVFCLHIFCFSFSEGKISFKKKAVSPRSHPTSYHIHTHVYFVHVYAYVYTEI